MKLLAYLDSLFSPSEVQGLKTDDVLAALNDQAVRKHWLWSVMEEMKEINRRTHIALINGKLTDEFVKESSKLQALDWAVRQILNSKTSMELDRRHNPDKESSVAVQLAP